MMAHEIALGRCCDKLDSDIKKFKEIFEALLTSIASVKDEALSFKNVPTKIQSANSTTSRLSYPLTGNQACDVLDYDDTHSHSDGGKLEESETLNPVLTSKGSSILNELWEAQVRDSEAIEAKTTMLAKTSLLRTNTKESPLKERLAFKWQNSNNFIKQGSWPATLSVDWPSSLTSRYPASENAGQDVEGHMRNAITAMLQKSQELGRLDESASSSEDSGLNTAHVHKLVLTPTHPIRLLFDIASIVCLAYDLITIPLFLAWDVEETGILQYMQAAVMIFWTIDIIASFRSGYLYLDGVVTDPFKIAKRYVKGPFIIELSIVAIDWIGFIAVTTATGFGMGNTAQNTSKVMRFGKLSRVLRLVGVIRVAKVTDAFKRILDRNVSATVVLSLELLKLVLVIVYVNHVCGCIWFALSSNYIHSDTGARWTDQLIAGNGGPYGETTMLFQYFTAFHWSLTQMTPGSMQIQAQNSAERMFNVNSLLFGMLLFSSLISTLSTKMMALRMMNAARSAQNFEMMTFLRERHIPSSMAFIIKRQVSERMHMKEPLRQQNVTALKLLTERLQAELHTIICKPFISSNTVFVVSFRLARHHVDRICFQAMSFMAFNRHDILFNAGGDCNKAYVVTQGSLNYTQVPETALVDQEVSHRVDVSSWLCEASLWVEWIHVGAAECLGVVELLIVNAAILIDVAKKNLILTTFLSHFGRAYHKHLVSPGCPTPHDLCGRVVDNTHILSTMDSDFAMLISFVSLEILADASWRFDNKTAPLAEEVRLGRTMLTPRSDTQVQRSVHVSCLKLFRDDGHILVLLGMWDQSKNIIEVSVKLPGSKIMGWEHPELALVRFVKEDIAMLERFITVENFEIEHEIRKSRTYGIVTDYTRNVFEATIMNIPEFTDAEPFPHEEKHRRVSKASIFSRDAEQASRPPNGRKRDFTCLTFKNQRHMHVYAWMAEETFLNMTSTSSSLFVEQLMQDFDIEEATELNLESSAKNSVDFSV